MITAKSPLERHPIIRTIVRTCHYGRVLWWIVNFFHPVNRNSRHSPQPGAKTLTIIFTMRYLIIYKGIFWLFYDIYLFECQTISDAHKIHSMKNTTLMLQATNHTQPWRMRIRVGSLRLLNSLYRKIIILSLQMFSSTNTKKLRVKPQKTTINIK